MGEEEERDYETPGADTRVQTQSIAWSGWSRGPVGSISQTNHVCLIRPMRKIEGTNLHLVYPPNWKTSCFVRAAKRALQTHTEFGTDVKTSVSFPVVTPTKSDCLIKQRPQFITLMNIWWYRRWGGEIIHTGGAHFQRLYSKRNALPRPWPVMLLTLSVLEPLCNNQSVSSVLSEGEALISS